VFGVTRNPIRWDNFTGNIVGMIDSHQPRDLKRWNENTSARGNNEESDRDENASEQGHTGNRTGIAGNCSHADQKFIRFNG
jgi:hypothetical protein